MIHVHLPDGAARARSAGATAADCAAANSPGLAKRTVAASVAGHLVDLSAPLSDGAVVADTLRAAGLRVQDPQPPEVH